MRDALFVRSRAPVIVPAIHGPVEAVTRRGKWVGAHPEIGSTYAVSGDGVGKVTCQGVSLSELFPEAIDDNPDHPDYSAA